MSPAWTPSLLEEQAVLKPAEPWRFNRPLALALALALSLGLSCAVGHGLTPARTQENVQRKAVIVGHGAKLYRGATGDDAIEAPFMQIYFMLEGGAGGRVPVSLAPNKDTADGWLEPSSFAEWNTLQMINFEPQSGRELAKIFADPNCAEQFGQKGRAAGCDELGAEPNRTQERNDYSLLIPVFERSKDNYQGGFVRVLTQGPEVVPQPAAKNREADSGSGDSRLGYDLILVVDSTASMEEWFEPTTEVLEGFIHSVESTMGGGELKSPFNVGLLFYRDRKAQSDCDIGYLTRWAVDLTDEIEQVTQALRSEREATCGSDEVAEAVYDALNRAILDPSWHDAYFKVILLIGDSPPHSASNEDKNPLGFTVDKITEMSEERNVRILSFKIGTDRTTEFKDLALSVDESVIGRFRAIEESSSDYKQALLTAMQEEWSLLTTANQVYADRVSGPQLATDPALARSYNIDAYELPIIVANLPSTAGGDPLPEFVQGWVPKRVKKKLAVGEYVFMGQGRVRILANVIDTISVAANDGATQGGESFIDTLRNSLAGMLNVQPTELFRAGESLASMMRKAEILPFKTTALSFTAEEVNTWKPADFQRLNQILGEKIEVLREHIQKPTNLRYFGEKPHVYVPRNLFP